MVNDGSRRFGRVIKSIAKFLAEFVRDLFLPSWNFYSRRKARGDKLILPRILMGLNIGFWLCVVLISSVLTISKPNDVEFRNFVALKAIRADDSISVDSHDFAVMSAPNKWHRSHKSGRMLVQYISGSKIVVREFKISGMVAKPVSKPYVLAGTDAESEQGAVNALLVRYQFLNDPRFDTNQTRFTEKNGLLVVHVKNKQYVVNVTKGFVAGGLQEQSSIPKNLKANIFMNGPVMIDYLKSHRRSADDYEVGGVSMVNKKMTLLVKQKWNHQIKQLHVGSEK